MPIYEYKCQDCGEKSEFRITSQAQVDSLACKSCGSQKLKKLLSVPAAITTGKSEASGAAGGSCCGNPGGCSQPGHCCGH